MRILHYSLGFPPYRSGGMTKYCLDLMLTQKEQGNRVGLLWPGEINFLKKNSVLKRKDNYGLESYEIINPLPVPMDEGVRDIEYYMTDGDSEICEQFLRSYKADVLHIHTLMGLHKEWITAAQKAGVKTLFTTHDYYGICPKVTLYREGSVCDCDHECVDCINCNNKGLAQSKIKLLQSPIYRKIKNCGPVKKIRKKHRCNFYLQSAATAPAALKEHSKSEVKETIKKTDYQSLRQFYLSMLTGIDVIHFNSSVTQKVYMRYFIPENSSVIPISHRGIEDNRIIKAFDSDDLRISFLSPFKPFKGSTIIKDALDEIWAQEKHNFSLRIIEHIESPSPYMIIQDGYEYDELKKIFEETDLLIAPSICYETFGFTVLEALSHGVPVLVSENVGAKDLIKKEYGIVIAPDKEALKEAILQLLGDKTKCRLMNLNNIKKFTAPSVRDIERLYI
ncbi:glycosyltransferase [uncultured Clostridium sp.]|uniref:glycosyltransferase n=1 Tax=uncultured Clostridium sp. TaxID=59620 RepID=UPI0025D06F51|nr:glycosyltransferase [uncultured Clostridium sp.]